MDNLWPWPLGDRPMEVPTRVVIEAEQDATVAAPTMKQMVSGERTGNNG